MASKQPPRKRIRSDIEENVLIKSRRRCALCFFYEKKNGVRRGQIAHLDRRRANNVQDNLAWLCWDHHTEYDSKASQHKNYTIGEVKHARRALYKWIEKDMTPLPRVTKDSPEKPKRKTPQADASGGPEVVIEYVYAENDKEHHDANAPLVLKNVSTVPAYNVQVLPLTIDGVSAAFEPNLISFIEARGTKNVFVDVADASPFFGGRRRLPDFLFKSYKDTSFEELLGTKSFVLRVKYTGIDETVFETECELLFRPRKKETKIGRIRRAIVRGNDPHLTSSPPRAGRQLPADRPKVAAVSYGKGERDREGLEIANEGTPAYDLQIETINLREGWTVRFDEVSGPVEKKAFAESWVWCRNQGSTTLDPVWRSLYRSGELPVIFPFVISYRDFDGRHYRTVSELHRDVLKKSGFDVKYVGQEGGEHRPTASFPPILSYEGVASGGGQLFESGPMNLQIATIRNIQVAVRNTARSVRASLDYRHAGGDHVRVRSVLWIKEGVRYHLANLSGNESIGLIILTQAKGGNWFATIDESYTEQTLDVGHWSIQVTISGDNCQPIVLEGGFTIFADGNRLVYDQPALRIVT